MPVKNPPDIHLDMALIVLFIWGVYSLEKIMKSLEFSGISLVPEKIKELSWNFFDKFSLIILLLY